MVSIGCIPPGEGSIAARAHYRLDTHPVDRGDNVTQTSTMLSRRGLTMFLDGVPDVKPDIYPREPHVPSPRPSLVPEFDMK